MKEYRLPIGSSDPVSFTCTCPASSNPSGGLVLLFYRYFADNPRLPSSLLSHTDDPTSFASFHTNLTSKYRLGGKLRISREGFNITIGGTQENVKTYMQECLSHWSFSGLELSTEASQVLFFKPTKGCSCVFGGPPASVRVTAEITPMGVTNYAPEDWNMVESLSPAEFHERCWSDEKKVLIDMRNHYESRIGYFFDPVTRDKAITPQIRRFSQWPLYVKSHMAGAEPEGGEENFTGKGRQIMTYCTGGIRCEKGARFLAENMKKKDGRVCTLRGGIAAYMMWMEEEIKEGRRTAEESLFRGRNYVFDARGSTALSEDIDVTLVSECQTCGTPSARLSKCRSEGCHLILVVCLACEDSADPRCCQNCLDIESQSSTEEGTPKVSRPICSCEQERELKLWGDWKPIKTQGWRKAKSQNLRSRGLDTLNIPIKIID